MPARRHKSATGRGLGTSSHRGNAAIAHRLADVERALPAGGIGMLVVARNKIAQVTAQLANRVGRIGAAAVAPLDAAARGFPRRAEGTLAHLGKTASVGVGWGAALLAALTLLLARLRVAYGWMAAPLLIAGGVRLGLFAMASVAARIAGPGAFTDAIDIWGRWDAQWYVGIARYGYFYSPTAQSSAVFYPLLPLLMSALGAPLSLIDPVHPYLLAGMLLSWASFLAACCLFYRLTWDRFGPTAARTAVLLLSVFPFAYFFGTAYTESIFLLFAMIAFLGIERRQWWLAASAALLASATRPTGLFLGACVVLAYALDWWKSGRRPRWDVFALLLTPLGWAAYLAYCYVMFGDPFAPMVTSEAGWRRGRLRWDGLLQGGYLLTHPDAWLTGTQFKPLLFGIYAVLTVLFLFSVIFIWRRLGPVYTLYALLGILVPILTCDVMVSEGRYLSVIFPTFMVLGHALRRRPALRDALAVALACFLTLFAILFVLNFEMY